MEPSRHTGPTLLTLREHLGSLTMLLKTLCLGCFCPVGFSPALGDRVSVRGKSPAHSGRARSSPMHLSAPTDELSSRPAQAGPSPPNSQLHSLLSWPFPLPPTLELLLIPHTPLPTHTALCSWQHCPPWPSYYSYLFMCLFYLLLEDKNPQEKDSGRIDSCLLRTI